MPITASVLRSWSTYCHISLLLFLPRDLTRLLQAQALLLFLGESYRAAALPVRASSTGDVEAPGGKKRQFERGPSSSRVTDPVSSAKLEEPEPHDVDDFVYISDNT